jgi:hypothetical protein
MGIISLLYRLDFPVAASNEQALDSSAKARGGRLESVGQRDRGNVLQVLGADQRPKELWARTGYHQYQDAWSALFGPPAQYATIWAGATGRLLPGKVEIDHVLARSVAGKVGYRYGRLFPVCDIHNQHSGRSFERKVAANTTAGNQGGRPKHSAGIEMLDILGLGKVLNYSLIHATFSGGEKPPGADRNIDFLREWDDEARTLRVLRAIGFYWW